MKLSVDMSIIPNLGAKLYEQDLMTVVVKECLQNSLDANASEVWLTIKDEGDGDFRVTIADNGDGILDFAKHMATIGGTYKNKEGSIGGFGVAKLAIMSMKSWKITSISGALSMDILLADQDIDTNEVTQNGTVVTGLCPNKYWQPERRISEWLQLCDFRGADVYLNGKLVVKKPMTEVSVLEKTILQYEGENYVVCRLNGLVMFKSQYYLQFQMDNGKGYIYDIETSLTPYDDGYPLNATRESLSKDSEHHASFNNVKETITTMRNNSMRMEKKLNDALFYSPKYDAYYSGDMEDSEIKSNLSLLKKWRKIVESVLDVCGYNPASYRYAIGSRHDCKAAYMPESEAFIIDTNSSTLDKADMLLVAIHEICHIKEEYHDADFVAEYQRLMHMIIIDKSLLK
jgi:hypothetical protein